MIMCVLLLNRRSDSSHDMHFNLSYITPERRWIKVSDLLLDTLILL